MLDIFKIIDQWSRLRRGSSEAVRTSKRKLVRVASDESRPKSSSTSNTTRVNRSERGERFGSPSNCLSKSFNKLTLTCRQLHGTPLPPSSMDSSTEGKNSDLRGLAELVHKGGEAPSQQSPTALRWLGTSSARSCMMSFLSAGKKNHELEILFVV